MSDANPIMEALKQVAALKEAEAKAEVAYDDAKKARIQAEGVAIGLMEAEGVKSVKIEGFGGFGISTRYFASIPKEKQSEAMAAFKAAYPELVVEYIHPATLSGFVSDFRKEGQDVPPEVAPFVSVVANKGVTWRRG